MGQTLGSGAENGDESQPAGPCQCHRGLLRLVRPALPPREGSGLSRSARGASSCTLRIVQITDVYMLDNFPHLRTLVQEKRAELEARGGGDRTISMLTGDFLAPYLLSSFDNGAGMMSMLNATPIDYLTWGNHEDDVGHAAVMRREREYQGRWINTNMQSHESFKNSKCQVDAEVIEISSPDGTNKRRIGLIGVLSSSPSLYKPGAFGGATIEDPWETMRVYKEKLEKERGCDLVIPLCHLYEPQDLRTCAEFDFPLILSGHDHHVVDRMEQGTRLLKPGLDGHKAFCVDITWTSGKPGKQPDIDAELLTVKDWPADQELVAVAEKAYSVLDPLRRTQLANIPAKYRPLTSFNARGCRVSMGTYLLSRMRDALNMYTPLGGEPRCHAAMLKGGNVRGGKNYEDTDQLTLEVLQSELEGTKEVVVVPVPGLVLRVGLRETYKAPNPGWMQYDDGVELDEDGYVTHVGGQPLDMAKIYKVASISDFWRKRDAPTIGAYFELHPEELPEHDSGVPMHVLLIRLFAMQIWERIWKALQVDFERGIIDEEAFRRMDQDGDGKLSRQDIKQAVENIAGLETFAGQDVVIDYMLEELTAFQRSGPTTQEPAAITRRTLGEAAKHWSGASLHSMVGDETTDEDEEEEEAAA
mmetsp:Transcript_23911/g.60427  ORF Transcript_23911/g.60427 Transcript_23911/m.60427 type:complete len:643 (+) Transcript_23911:135-2063(+)